MKKNRTFKLELLVLSILSHGENYGYGISTAISNISDGAIVIREGVLYPILYKLLDSGKISSREITINSRVRVYYEITDIGRSELVLLLEEYRKNLSAVDSILTADVEAISKTSKSK